MSSIRITLKKINQHEWRLFTPKGHTVGPVFRGSEYKVFELARQFCSTWQDWVVDLGDTSEERGRILGKDVPGFT